MKQKVISFCAMALILIILPSQNNPPMQYTVTLPIEAWQALLVCLDKSNAEHLQVKELQNLIIPQLQKQIADTTKKK